MDQMAEVLVVATRGTSGPAEDGPASRQAHPWYQMGAVDSASSGSTSSSPMTSARSQRSILVSAELAHTAFSSSSSSRASQQVSMTRRVRCSCSSQVRSSQDGSAGAAPACRGVRDRARAERGQDGGLRTPSFIIIRSEPREDRAPELQSPTGWSPQAPT